MILHAWPQDTMVDQIAKRSSLYTADNDKDNKFYEYGYDNYVDNDDVMDEDNNDDGDQDGDDDWC